MSSMLFYPGTPSVSGSGAGPFTPGVGSAVAPTYSFAGHTTTGMYYDTTNSALGFSVNGTERWYMDGSGNLVNPNSANTSANVLRLGPATSAGVQIARNGSGVVQFSNADLSANATLVAATFQTANALGGISSTFSPNTGIQMNTSDRIQVVNAGTISLQIDANGRFNALKQQVSSKTQAASPYTVLTADSFTQFDNTGATGSVTFTLPAIGTANLGVRVGFFVAAAQTIVVTANAADTIGTKAAGSSYTGAVVKGNYLELVACNGGWAITSNTGYT